MRFAAILILSICLTACATQQQTATTKQATTKADYTNQLIVFGSGGGFTGQVISYELHPDGQLFLKKGMPSQQQEMSMLKVVPSAEVNNLFYEINAGAIKTSDFNMPDNMSYFVILKEGNMTYKNTWGGINHPSQDIEALYEKLNNLITN